ncbi:MAG: hypothetical protein FD180_406 [Planctomycetota bacterium]|nr:MAG: hypothetical protein FD180_406 [Planctomycetota bacterium]
MPDPLAPIAPDAWNPALARHLLNRAGFGIPLHQVELLAALTPEVAVARFVDFDARQDWFQLPDFLPEPFDFAAKRREVAGLTEEERKELFKDRMREEHQAIAQLQDWWLDQMLTTLRPLQAKLTLFWHGHFATSAQKVKSCRNNWQLFQVFRNGAAGNFRELVRSVGKSPAMLEYLDNEKNRKGHPNENWGRELMELFTMGRGNYTEDDIKEAARAFTGWTRVGEKFWFNGRAHDEGVKTVLGRKGAFDGDEAVDIVVENPATARFVAKKLWEFFAYEEPETEIVDGLARVFTEAKFELKPVLRTMFLSEAFHSPRCVGNQIKSPVQLVLGLLDALDVPLGQESGKFARLILTGLGQDLFHPPNVKGWPGNRAWIDTNTLLLRCNAAGILVNGLDPEDTAGGEGEGARRKGLPRRIRSPFEAMKWAGRKLAGAKSAEVAADRVVDILLGRRPTAEQRTVLARSLGAGSGQGWKANEEGVRAVVHLVTSMAEYQLC